MEETNDSQNRIAHKMYIGFLGRGVASFFTGGGETGISVMAMEEVK